MQVSIRPVGLVFRKIKLSTCSALSAALWAETTSPAVEKTLSDGTDVPGIPKYFLANLASSGNLS